MIKRKKIPALAIALFSISWIPGATLPALGPIPPIASAFGIPVSDSPASKPYLSRHVEMKAPSGDILAGSSGSLLFIQTGIPLIGGLPRPIGNIGAYTHADGIVLAYFGADYKPDAGIRNFEAGTRLGELDARESQTRYSLSVYDSRTAAWMNPLLLSVIPTDKHEPRIDGLALQRQNIRLEYIPSAKTKTKLRQGTYDLYVRAEDPIAGGQASGIYRYTASMDGRSLADHVLDVARGAEAGLSFLGFAAPSTSILDREWGIKIAAIAIPRGQHLLEVSVADFAGSRSLVVWKLEAE
ncbi:MAG TPA: hypothetical protein VIO60_10395 [Rectinemataceae bacterium]